MERDTKLVHRFAGTDRHACRIQRTHVVAEVEVKAVVVVGVAAPPEKIVDRVLVHLARDAERRQAVLRDVDKDSTHKVT